MDKEKTVKVEADDKMMNFERDGQIYRANDHVMDVPESFARDILKADVPGVRLHKPTFSFSHVSDEVWNRAMGRS